MGKLQTIYVDETIAANPKYRELLRTKKLSETFNAFIKEHLNVIDEVTNKDIEELQDELSHINIKKAMIQEKVKDIEKKAIEKKKKEAEEAAKWKEHIPLGHRTNKER